MAAHHMTDAELEQVYISNVKMYARIIAENTSGNCDSAFQHLSDNQERLIDEFGWDWEQTEQLWISAYKAA